MTWKLILGIPIISLVFGIILAFVLLMPLSFLSSGFALLVGFGNSAISFLIVFGLAYLLLGILASKFVRKMSGKDAPMGSVFLTIPLAIPVFFVIGFALGQGSGPGDKLIVYSSAIAPVILYIVGITLAYTKRKGKQSTNRF